MKKVISVLMSGIIKDMLHQLLGKNSTEKFSGKLQVLPVGSAPAPIHTASNKKRSLSFIAGAFVLLMICTSLTSCFTSGYGCKGKSRIMTRVN